MPGATFDHLVHWVVDLEQAMNDYAAVGIPTRPTLSMPGFKNADWGIDDERYLELATVTDWEAVTTSKYAAGVQILKPAIDAIGGHGLVAFAIDVTDARALADRFRATGHEVDLVEVFFEEKDAGFVEVFVRDLPNYFPFFITYHPPRTEIARMRSEYRAKEGISLAEHLDLEAIVIGSAEPESDALTLGELVGCSVNGAIVNLPGAEIRFEADAPPGLSGLVVRGLSLDEPVMVAGARVIPAN